MTFSIDLRDTTQSGHCRNVRLLCSGQVQSIKRADRLADGLLYVCIDHGGLEIAVPQKQLDGPNVRASRQQVSGKRVA